MEATSAASARFALVPLAKIRPPSHQLRDKLDSEQLAELADSMATEGLHQPIGLRGPFADDEWEVIWGYRRLTAAQGLGWGSIKAMLYPASFEPYLAAVHENLMRADLTPLEEARAVGELRARGLSNQQIARNLRRSPSWVVARVALLDAPPDVQSAVHERRVPIGVGQALAAIDDPGYRGELVAEAARTGATIGLCNIWVAEYAKDRDRLLRNREHVSTLLTRALAVQNMTECQGCGNATPWAEIYPMRFCGGCFTAINDELARAARDGVRSPTPAVPGE